MSKEKQYWDRFDKRITRKITRANVSAYARLVWMELALYGEEAFPSQKRLAKDLGCSDRQIRRAITELKEAGLVEVTLRRDEGKTSIHKLIAPSIPVDSVRGDRTYSPEGQDNKSGGVGRLCPIEVEKAKERKEKKRKDKEREGMDNKEVSLRYLAGEIDLLEMTRAYRDSGQRIIKMLDVFEKKNFGAVEKTVEKMGLAGYL